MAQDEKALFVHSRCCMAHWELVYDHTTHSYKLVCERCGEPAGVTVTGPHLGCECELCRKEKDG